MASRENMNKVAMGAGVVAVAAAAAAAGAVIANKDLRKKVGKRSWEALQTVSRLAAEAERQAEKGVRALQNRSKQLPKEVEKVAKPKKSAASKKAAKKS